MALPGELAVAHCEAKAAPSDSAAPSHLSRQGRGRGSDDGVLEIWERQDSDWVSWPALGSAVFHVA